MRILITGANGQLGKDFQRLFNKLEVFYLPTDYKTQLQDLDIRNISKIKEIVTKNKIDTIINCAAYNDVDNAERNYKNAYRINSIGVKNLAKVSKKANIELIHYSTDYVFDGKKGQPYTTNDKPNPISKYGYSKFLGENFLIKNTKKFFLIRTSWVFGNGNINFIKKVLNWSRNNTVLRIVTDQISSPTYTRDLAAATLDLVKTKKYGVYHITNSGSCSRFEWAKFILDLTRWKGTLLEAKSSDFKTLANRPATSILDTSKTVEILGYELPNWKDATKRFLQELKEAQ
ncbi:MAG: dTDP-4-dehydrorhamnose reductase [Candidatus Heimdallarchaeaceae archaeon]